jgi:WD40 repeat protein
MARYDGFMSYSHAADGKLAPAIQAALHGLGRAWYKLRALSVFRDKTSLSADPGLWPAIERALSNARWFIYLASPKAAHSEWVGREVAWWLAKNGSSSLLIIVTEGTIAWDGAKNDFDWNATDAVPAALAGRFAAEPLWVDLRWARNQDNLSLRHAGFRDAILDIAAPLHGRPKDELDGADVRQYRRNRRTAAAAIGALVVLTIGAVTAAYLAIQQSRLSSSRELAAYAIAQLDGDPELSVRLALLALDSAETAQAEDALRRALAESRTLYTVTAPTEVSVTRFSRDGRAIALASGRQVAIIDAATGAVRRALAGDASQIPCLAFSADSRLIAGCGADGTVHIWTVASGDPLRSFKAASGEVQRVEFNLDGDLLATTHGLPMKRADEGSGTIDLGDSAVARVWNVATGELVAELEHGDILEDVAFDPAGRYVVTAGYGATVKIWDVGSGALHETLSGHSGRVLAVRFSRDGQALITVDEELIVKRWNPATGALAVSGGQRAVVSSFVDGTSRDAWISPGGSRAVVRTGMSAKAYDTGTGREISGLKDMPTSIHQFAFSEDERLLAF